MAFRAIRVALLLSSLPLTGCGTAANLVEQRPGAGGVIPFGGVKHDVACISQGAKEPGGAVYPKSELQRCKEAALPLLCLADLPLSLIGDVVTWPYTASYTFINQPTPVPPVTPAPTPPLQQGASAGQPQIPPLETLPEPRTMPRQ